MTHQTLTYPVVIEAGEFQGYGAFFPDLPGCVGAGWTLESCYSDARAALAMHVAGIDEDGDQLPSPTPFDSVPDYPGVRVVAILLAPLDRLNPPGLS